MPTGPWLGSMIRQYRRPLFLIEKVIQRCKIAGSYVSSNRRHANTATRLPRGYRVALYLWICRTFARAQPAFLTQNLHQPFGLISPSTSVQAFGSWNREQLLHS